MKQRADTVGLEYFDRDVAVVARDLIGRTLRVLEPAGICHSGLVVETEAYGGIEDPASHASFKPGGRAGVMFGPPGIVYVYAAYGMYPCFNIVTGPDRQPGAVLLRGVWIDGQDEPTLGPGRITRALNITLSDQGASLDGRRFSISSHRKRLAIVETPRIGITRGVATPWRFIADIAQPSRNR